MSDVDEIEAINVEQLVTVTDRLLLRQGRVPKRRPSMVCLGPPFPLESNERTVIIRRPRRVPVDPTVVLSSAIVTLLMFIAVLV